MQGGHNADILEWLQPIGCPASNVVEVDAIQSHADDLILANSMGDVTMVHDAEQRTGR